MNLTTKLSLLLFCSVTALTNAAAQSSDCRISYAYDAAGNRIRRSFNCDAAPYPWDNTSQQTHKLLSGLNPNPTSGSVTGTFYEPVSSAFVEVNSMEGIAVATLTINQLCSSFTMDLSGLIPGTYIVTIRVPELIEGYTLIKM